MHQEIKLISLSSFIGDVNCYLLKTEDEGFVLVDTGLSNSRKQLLRDLEIAGCKPGNLKLIILTHGDLDHVGNAAFLRQKYAAKIAIHPLEAKAVITGNMFATRKSRNLLGRIIFSTLLARRVRFTPDLYLEDGDDLTAYGLDARILHIPGHSIGSIGVLTAEGDLICGDMFANTDKPELNPIMDDVEAAKECLFRLDKLSIKTIFPGHGTPFAMKNLQTV